MARRGLGVSVGRGIGAGALLALVAVASPAAAEVRHEGDWSGEDPEVSLDLDNVPRAEAVKRLASAAGWSVVVNAPKGDLVSLHVEDQPASKVLDLLLADARYVARRDDKRIAISVDDGLARSSATPTAPIPPVPPVPPVPRCRRLRPPPVPAGPPCRPCRSPATAIAIGW